MSNEVRTNIVLIVADQLNFRLLGCMGHQIIKTPNIDRLASEGVDFENAYSQAPIYMPSRASFNTGVYPHSCNVLYNPVVLEDHHTTLAERLKKVGYNTAGIGHIGGDGVERGFDTCIDIYDEPLKSANHDEQLRLLKSGGKPGDYCGVTPIEDGKIRDQLIAELGCDYIRETKADEPFYLQLDKKTIWQGHDVLGCGFFWQDCGWNTRRSL